MSSVKKPDEHPRPQTYAEVQLQLELRPELKEKVAGVGVQLAQRMAEAAEAVLAVADIRGRFVIVASIRERLPVDCAGHCGKCAECGGCHRTEEHDEFDPWNAGRGWV